MKNIFVVLFIFNLISCSTSKVTMEATDYKDLEIIENTKIDSSDAINYNELRFYDIQSANDTMKLMYLNFGDWDGLEESSYMLNTHSKIWEDVELFDDMQTFTIIADGTETKVDYFASLKIIDSTGNDCLKDEHPLKNKLIHLFYNKFKKTKSVYKRMESTSKRKLNKKLWI
ncbi:MAG: hypothetical protein LAT51_13110 [Flavobacteriaceae bacterium]|nr:hypothetical protein [Flavobacteriaceae bacterium]